MLNNKFSNINIKKIIIIWFLITIIIFIFCFIDLMFPFFIIGYHSFSGGPIFSSDDYNELFYNGNFVLKQDLYFAQPTNETGDNFYYYVVIRNSSNEGDSGLYFDPLNYYFLNKNKTHNILRIYYASIVEYNELFSISIIYHYAETNNQVYHYSSSNELYTVDGPYGYEYRYYDYLCTNMNRFKWNIYKLNEDFLNKYEDCLKKIISKDSQISNDSYYSYVFLNEYDEVAIEISFIYNDVNSDNFITREVEYENTILNYIYNNIVILEK